MASSARSRRERVVDEHRRALSWIAAAVVTGAWLALSVYLDHELRSVGQITTSDPQLVLATVAGLAGSLLGFVLAASAFLFGIDGTRGAARITSSAAYTQLWAIFLAPTKSLGALTALALALLVFGREGAVTAVASWLVVFLVVLATVQLALCIWAFENVVRVLVARRATPQRPSNTGAVEDGDSI